MVNSTFAVNAMERGGSAVEYRTRNRESPGAKTIKKNTNSTQNKYQTHSAKLYEVTSFLSTGCELSTETCSKNVYSLGPGFDSPLLQFQSLGIVCLHSAPCSYRNEDLAIDSGGNVDE